MDAREILFVGQSVGAGCYHRIMLPALAIGSDWCGLDAPPPRMVVGRGAVRGDLASYRTVVIQTPAQDGWLDVIAALQAGGTSVLYEVDYDLHALAQPPEMLALIEALVAMCDGVICATARVAERYRELNPRTYVCPSGIDLRPYALTRPPHDTVNIGWAGTTLELDEMQPALEQVAGVMRAREVTNFISIGQPFADVLAEMGVVAPERCLSIPAMLPEQYPAAMSIFDIAFDPLGRRPWRRARSPLRWLEAAAWGIPFVGDPRIYPDVEPGRTGFHAADAPSLGRELLRLVDDPGLRAALGTEARRVVAERFTIDAVAPAWIRAFEAVCE
jgi:hypothetical protein